jgi:hypothetical protein
MKKYGSDPEGSQVQNLERREAIGTLDSIKYGETAQDTEMEEKDQGSLWREKEWTPSRKKSRYPQTQDQEIADDE